MRGMYYDDEMNLSVVLRTFENSEEPTLTAVWPDGPQHDTRWLLMDDKDMAQLAKSLIGELLYREARKTNEESAGAAVGDLQEHPRPVEGP